MPVYYVAVNIYCDDGRLHPCPELIGITTSVTEAASAIASILHDEVTIPRDVDVEVLSASRQCWFASRPDEPQ